VARRKVFLERSHPDKRTTVARALSDLLLVFDRNSNWDTNAPAAFNITTTGGRSFPEQPELDSRRGASRLQTTKSLYLSACVNHGGHTKPPQRVP
jgi:hypothetical protein